MALIKYGGGIVQMSGSIAGNTHARNRFGNYMRARTKPVNPKSTRQSGARIAIMFLAEQWRESPMTDDIRTAWQTYADSVSWQNKLGEAVKLTGFNCFIAGNAALLSAGASIVTAAPAALGLPPGDPAFAISNVKVAGQCCDIAFDDNFDWCSEHDAYILIHQGKPQSASRNFFGGPWRRYNGLEGDAEFPRTSPTLGISGFGFPFVLDQKLWWKARIVRADGRLSNPFQCDPTIVVA